MKNIAILFAILAILAVALVGTLYIFEAQTKEQAIDLLIKIEAGILLLGACSALVAALVGGKKKSGDGA